MSELIASKLNRRALLKSSIAAVSGCFFGLNGLAKDAQTPPARDRRPGIGSIKITDLKCAIIGRNPVIRIVTDQGISGYAQAESAKPFLKPMVEHYKPYLLGQDPTDVGRIMLRLRRMGAFKPWVRQSVPSRSHCGTWQGRPRDCLCTNCLAGRSTIVFVRTETRRTSVPCFRLVRRRNSLRWRER